MEHVNDNDYWDYREEENQRRWEQDQSRRRRVTDPRDPDFIGPEEGEDE